MCHLKCIDWADIIDIFWFLCGNSKHPLKLACVLPKRTVMKVYDFAKYRKTGAMGRVVKDFMRGQDVSQRACYKRAIAREKSLNHL